MTIPKDFSVKYNVVQQKNTFFLLNLKDEPFAKAYKSGQEDLFDFHLLTLNGQEVSTAHGVIETKNALVDVYDNDQKCIGQILRRKNYPLPSSYYFYNSEKKLIVEGTMNWLGTRCIFTAPGNTHLEYFMIYRPYFRLPGDYWYVQSIKPIGIDPKLMIFCGLLETYIGKKNWFISKNEE